MEPRVPMLAEPLDLGVHWLAEGPCWDARTGTLSWVDIMAGRIHEWRPGVDANDERTRRTIETGQPVGAAQPRDAGGYVCALRDGIGLVDGDGDLSWLAHGFVPESHRFNDAKVDARGRLWAGTVTREFGAGPGTLYRIEPDGDVRAMADVDFSNGLGWSPDGGTFYLADTTGLVLWAFAFDADAGEVSQRRRLVEFDPSGGMPDGLAVDVEGGIWVARYAGGVVERYSDAGVLTEVVQVAATQPTCPGFGGPDLTDLYVTTGWERMTDPGPDEGLLYVARPGVAGLPAHLFAG